MEQYYRPLQSRFDNFLSRHNNADEAVEIVSIERHEIGLYERNKSYVSYGVYIAEKTS